MLLKVLPRFGFGETAASPLRHPGLDSGSRAIKSLIAGESFTAQTRRGWMPDQVRHDGRALGECRPALHPFFLNHAER